MRASASKKTADLTWNFSSLFPNDSETEITRELKRVDQKIVAFASKWETTSDYLRSPSHLKQALDEYDDLHKHTGTSGNVGYYLSLRYAVDQSNTDLKAKLNQVEEFSQHSWNKIQFFTLRLAKVSEATQKLFTTSPDLKEYRHFLERLFAQSKYLLSEPEEKILTLKSGPAHLFWEQMTSTFVSKEQRAGKNLSMLQAELSSKSKSARDKAAKHIYDILAQHVGTAEQEINAILTNKKIDDELRHIPRPDLPRHLSDDIDSEVVDAMVAAVSSRFDISHRIHKLKAKLLGVPKMAYHERFVPYGKVNPKYTFDQAVKLVSQTFAQLDDQFVKILQSYLRNGQIDVYPRLGKSGGAFCADDMPTHPTYIMLNHTDRLDDVLTLAHEVGHGINNELMKTQAKAVNFGSPLSMAEVASTFMEDFVLQQLLKTAGPELRLALYVKKLDEDVNVIFRQVAAYKFETELHTTLRSKGYLSKEAIGQIFAQQMQAYLGKYVTFEPGAFNGWVSWSHFRTFFYVYSYASGLLISKSLQAQVKKDPGSISKVKQILSAGTVDSPKNIFTKYAGIDITNSSFWTNGLDEVESLLVEAERLVGKIK